MRNEAKALVTDARIAVDRLNAEAQQHRVFVWQKRPICVAKGVYVYGKRDLFMWQKRPICVAKEAYLYVKRGLFVRQKRPISLRVLMLRRSNTGYVYGKGDLFVWQKGSMCMAKETYLGGK